MGLAVQMIRGAAVLFVLLLVVAVVVTQTRVLGWLVLPRLSEAAGGEVSAKSVRLSADGVLLFEDLVVETAAFEGAAGRIFSAPRARAELGWPPGAGALERIVLERPTVRVSQGADFSVNLSGLLTGGRGTGTPQRLPDIEIVDGILELGEHDGAQYTPLATLLVHGELRRSTQQAGVYRIVLREMDGMRVDGSVDLNDQSARMMVRDVDLDAWARRSAPQAFRRLWEQMAVRGQVPEAELEFTREGGVRAKIHVAGVNMNIPYPEASETDPVTGVATAWRDGLLDMNDVTGTLVFGATGLTADVGGWVGDLRTRVRLTTAGFSLDAPLTCTIHTPSFVLEDDPRLLPFAPNFVRRIFQRFSGPTAELSGSTMVARDAQGAWTYSGLYLLENGRARYEGFPYPVENIRASFEFDQHAVRILDLTGRGPTGAHLLASGVIAPPGDVAAVEIDITVTELPMDEHFRDALPDDRRAAYEVLFNHPAYEALLDAGLVMRREERSRLETERRDLTRRLVLSLPEHEHAALRQRRDEVERRLAVPGFDLGGLATMDIAVRREIGEHTEYISDIRFRVDEAGVIPGAFAYPVRARDVDLRIFASVVHIPKVALEGIDGGRATIEGEVALLDDGGFEPSLLLSARDVPVDAYLLGAVPGGVAWEAGGAGAAEHRFGEGVLRGGFSAYRLMQALHLTGRVSCDARIFSDEAAGIRFSAVVGLDGVGSHPGSEGLRLDDVRGSIEISDESLRMDGVRARMGRGEIEAHLVATLGGDAADGGGSVEGLIRARAFDLERPIETILEVVSADAGRTAKEMRRVYRPAGVVDGRIEFRLDDAGFGSAITLHDAERIEFDLFGGRVSMDEVAGTLTVGNDAARFSGFGARVVWEDDPAVRISLDGTFALSRDVLGAVDLGVRGLDLSSGMTGALLETISAEGAQALRGMQARGVVDASASLTQRNGAASLRSWRIEPRWLSFVRGGERLEFARASGAIGWRDGRGILDALSLDAGTWAIGMDGVWYAPPRAGIDATMRVSGDRLPDEALGLFPGSVVEVLDRVGLRFDGAFEASPARLMLRMSESGDVGELAFDGAVRFEGAEVTAGIPLTEITGRAELMVRSEGGDALTLDTTIRAESLRAAGVRVTDGFVRLISGEREDSLILPRFEASCHGGRIAGRAAYGATGEGGGASELHLEAVDVSFGRLLADLGGDNSDDEIVDRGLLSGKLSLSWSDLGDRRGRGTFRVEGGDVLNQPGVMPLLQLSNLLPPAGEQVDLAYTEFFVVGDRVQVETMELYSPSLRIVADGVVLLPSLRLDMRVASSGTTHVPLLSDLFEKFRDELVTARVTGTLREPRFRLEQFSGARTLLETMIGTDSDARRQRE
ncbi:MAG: hypothetical protein EA380_09305 [Phycisphaeraceae bacterium]|nr:MAG: hypothetical protein EA380_09305 [Phycisphaeraceae bacterium]